MAETIPIAEIASRISKDIFSHFFWNTHPKTDENFSCNNETHTGDGGKPKKQHPADVVFFYDHPYLDTRIYLHTDLKSYGKDSITVSSIRNALRSLCMTTGCARESEEWRELYSVGDDERYDVQGLLFVHNHDHGFQEEFSKLIAKIDLSALPLAANSYVHFLGPEDIIKLYSVGNDLIRLKYEKKLPEDYTFYYPDLVMWRRQGDVWSQPATVEALTSPFFIIKHRETSEIGQGYLVYYNRKGASPEEFEYFFDSLSRFQMLEPDEVIRVRAFDKNTDPKMLSNFQAAKKRYVKAWGFDPARQRILEAVTLEPITSVADNYSPGYVGWRE